MTEFSRVALGAYLAATLIICSAVSASGEATLLVCTGGNTISDFKVAIDFAKKTIKLPEEWDLRNEKIVQLDITDTMITFLLTDTRDARHYRDYKIDRVTGLLSQRPCGPKGCGGWYEYPCHKGSKQF